jgi:CubicO group peptidase (beta-lactamase class C family)
MTGSGPVVRAWGPVPATSAFEAGSVTKAVTGLLLALAIEAGEVSGPDRLDRFLPGTGRAGQATLAELATHTSGLPRLPARTLLRALAHPGDPYKGSSVPRLIRDTRWVRPGTAGQAAYSNLGVALLGHALAAAATPPPCRQLKSAAERAATTASWPLTEPADPGRPPTILRCARRKKPSAAAGHVRR